jgi:hypothetical protein
MYATLKIQGLKADAAHAEDFAQKKETVVIKYHTVVHSSKAHEVPLY